MLSGLGCVGIHSFIYMTTRHVHAIANANACFDFSSAWIQWNVAGLSLLQLKVSDEDIGLFSLLVGQRADCKFDVHHGC